MRIFYSNAFIEDVQRIASYISDELHNPQSAAKLVNSFFDEVKRLEKSPFLGEQLLGFLRIGDADLRRLVFKNYIIVYRVTGDMVIAERVFYGRRDWTLILLGDIEESDT